MNSLVDQPVFSLEQYTNLTKHPKKEVRKWTCERLIDLNSEQTFPILFSLIEDSSAEIAIRAISYLAEKQASFTAPKILELFQQAELNLPAKSVLASWYAQALGTLNYAPALTAFSKYLTKHREDMGVLGICSALGDLHQPEARQMLLDLLKSLESTKDGNIPYLGDVAIDALLKHHCPEDISVVLRIHQVWRNAGHKNPRTLTALSKSAGDNQIYNRLDSLIIRGKSSWVETIHQEADQLEISLSELLDADIYSSLNQVLESEQPTDIIQWSLKATEKILSDRYNSLDTLKGYTAWSQEQRRQKITPPFLQDQLSLAIVEGLANPRYKLHPSKLDPATDQRQALLAVAILLEVAARQDYSALLAQPQSLSQIIKLLTAKRFYIPEEFEDKAINQGILADSEANALIKLLTLGETNYGTMRAVRLLGRIRYLPAIPFILDEITSDFNWMRSEGILALTRMGLDFIDYLEKSFAEITPGAWIGIAEILAHLPHEISSELAHRAWTDPQIPQSDGLFMVQERIGSLKSIPRLWEVYQTAPQIAGSSLELLCDIHDYDFPNLEEIKQANRTEAEEMATYQQEIWRQVNSQQEKEKEKKDEQKVKQLLAGDKPVKLVPIKATKIDRNHPCPCGSGNKYKKCCGK
jgi:hypothetical protein